MPDQLFADLPRDELSQGDLFDDIPHAELLGDRRIDGRFWLVVLSHDCEIDKPATTIVLCVRARILTDLDAGRAGDLRAGRVLNAMHLPAVSSFPEGYVDFRFIYRVPKIDLEHAIADGQRVASMSDDGRTALVTYLFRYFARQGPNV